MRELIGTALHPDDKQHVLRAYVHRMTTETRAQFPDFTRYMLAGGYRMTERSDAQWLASTYFRVRTDGRLDKRARHCRTTY